MFRIFYVHHQEEYEYIVHAALYCVFLAFMKTVYRVERCAQGCMYIIVFLLMNIRCSKLVEDKRN